MTVAELIGLLQACPQDAQIEAWDGDYQHPVPVTSVTITAGKTSTVCIWSDGYDPDC